MSEVGRLTIIGLGPKKAEELTLQAYQELQQVDKLIVRTRKHPVASYLTEKGIPFISFDELLTEGQDFNQIVNQISQRIKNDLSKNIKVGYAVPGNPLVGDESVNKLVAKLSEESIEVLPGIDSVELLKNNFEFDDLQVIDSLGFKSKDVDIEQDLILSNISNQKVVSRLKKKLLKLYPADHPIQIIEAGEDYITEDGSKFLLRDLDNLGEIKQLINLYIPSITERLDIDLNKLESLDTLVEVVAKLRGPDGCPWDLEQTHLSLRPHLIEETYEVLESIELDDTAGLCEELGDLLLHVIFHAQLAAERDDFTIEDVISGISNKMIRRHPHVFGAEELSTSEEVIKKWEEIKAAEDKTKEQQESILDITRELPALMEAQQLQSKAAKVGFDWNRLDGAVDKLKEELEEFEESLMLDQQDRVKEELGDLIFAVVNISRFLDLNSELVLHDASRKFKTRFQYMEQQVYNTDDRLSNMALNELEELWQRAKIELEEEKINDKFK